MTYKEPESFPENELSEKSDELALGIPLGASDTEVVNTSPGTASAVLRGCVLSDRGRELLDSG